MGDRLMEETVFGLEFTNSDGQSLVLHLGPSGRTEMYRAGYAEGHPAVPAGVIVVSVLDDPASAFRGRESEGHRFSYSKIFEMRSETAHSWDAVASFVLTPVEAYGFLVLKSSPGGPKH